MALGRIVDAQAAVLHLVEYQWCKRRRQIAPNGNAHGLLAIGLTSDAEELEEVVLDQRATLTVQASEGNTGVDLGLRVAVPHLRPL